MNDLDVYDFIAQENPEHAIDVIRSYGYNVGRYNSADGLAADMQTLVSNHGEGAFYKLMKAHPHAKLFEEIYSNADGQLAVLSPSSGNQSLAPQPQILQSNTGGPYLTAKDKMFTTQNLVIVAITVIIVAYILKKPK